MQPLNQVPEREARERVLKIEPRFGIALHDLVGGSDWQPLMMFRAGYPTRDAERSPRRSVEEVVDRAFLTPWLESPVIQSSSSRH